MRNPFFSVLLLVSLATTAQTYQPNWESLDKRPVPQWFHDAKFGIFIHWGVYSVPGWCTKGNYAEWYQYGLQTNDTSRMKFHKAKFGERSYYDLANDFKAELFNPDEWAQLFERSGAKYIVLTSKHHDGFALWPSHEANKTWGFPWNAKDIGPHRDLLGDLFNSVRKTSVRAGMYYSLYEWFNPLWKSDRQRFVAEHTWPQMKELINKYQPDVFWTDGDWDAPPETWKSQEFLSWLYSDSPVKNKIVVNDRWGSGVRFHHGGIYTPEYQPNLEFDDHAWEESRGMGFSYGYNREEDAWDYNSAQSLVLQLIDKVSRGGNFLLDIGPDEHGKIPPIMQERLLQIGEWLRINGEAIYNTDRWLVPSQWSEGRRDYKPKTGSGDLLLKLTVDPDPGYAVKEVFYSYNASTNSLYAIFPRYPDNLNLTLNDISLPAGTKVSFLSTGELLNWQQQGNKVVIGLPVFNPNKIKSPLAFAVKIENFGRYSPKPKIAITYAQDGLIPMVSLATEGNGAIRYTTDGSEPDANSELYLKPITLSKTATVKARLFREGSLPSAVADMLVKRFDWLPGLVLRTPKRGIAYSYFEPQGNIDMSVLMGKPLATGVSDLISLDNKLRKEKFAFRFTGYIQIAKDGIYNFYTESDDGSRLQIDEELVVDNDGDHGPEEKEGKVALKKGWHRIMVQYFDSGGGNTLRVSMQPPNGKKEILSAAQLFH